MINPFSTNEVIHHARSLTLARATLLATQALLGFYKGYSLSRTRRGGV